MPRTFKATIALIAVLGLLVLATFINIVQINSTEDTVKDLRQKVDSLAETNDQILQRLEQGVAVAGGGTASNGGGVDKYADALQDPDNILKGATDLQVPAEAKEGGTLRRILSSDMKGFNWITESSVDVADLQAHVHDTFARRDFNNPDNWVPELAYKITVNDDYTEYTIHLRDDVYWQRPNVDFSNPKYAWLKPYRKLTAEDCAFYFELIKNPQVEAGSIKSYYEDLDKVEVIDEHTFKVTWKKKVYHSLDFTIGLYPMPKWLYTVDEEGNPLPEETIGLKFNSHWASNYAVGTGPYKLVSSEKGGKTILERFERYWGKRFPIERIEYQVVNDPETQYVKLKANEVDIIPKVPSPKYKSDILEGKDTPFTRGELEYKFVDIFAYYYFGWNADTPLFSDKRVRRAMTHSLDRQGIIENVLHGLGTIQTGPFYYKHPATDASIQPWPYDLNEARRLLEEAGWKDTDGDGVRDKVIRGQKTDFKFAMLAYDKPETKSVLSIWKEDLRKIGVIMTAQHVDWPTMQKKMDEKKFEAFTGGWGLSWLINPNQIWHSSQADIPKGSNRVGFRNPRADEIIEELLVTFDEKRRMELYHEFHKLLHEEQPYTFFYAPQYVTAWQPRLENVVINSVRPQRLSLPWYLDDSQKKAKVQGK